MKVLNGGVGEIDKVFSTALELVPGVKQACKGEKADECPFAGKEIEFDVEGADPE